MPRSPSRLSMPALRTALRRLRSGAAPDVEAHWSVRADLHDRSDARFPLAPVPEPADRPPADAADEPVAASEFADWPPADAADEPVAASEPAVTDDGAPPGTPDAPVPPSAAAAWFDRDEATATGSDPAVDGGGDEPFFGSPPPAPSVGGGSPARGGLDADIEPPFGLPPHDDEPFPPSGQGGSFPPPGDDAVFPPSDQDDLSPARGLDTPSPADRFPPPPAVAAPLVPPADREPAPSGDADQSWPELRPVEAPDATALDEPDNSALDARDALDGPPAAAGWHGGDWPPAASPDAEPAGDEGTGDESAVDEGAVDEGAFGEGAGAADDRSDDRPGDRPGAHGAWFVAGTRLPSRPVLRPLRRAAWG